MEPAWRPVTAADAPALEAALAPHPVEGLVFASAMLEAAEHGFDLGDAGLWGDFAGGGPPRALATTRRTIDLFAPDPAAWDGLAAFLAPWLAEAPTLLGFGAVVDHVVARLPAPPGPVATDERYALLTRPRGADLPAAPPGFRPAGPEDLRDVASNAATMIAAETGRDPRDEDADAFYRGVAWEILNGRYYVWEVDGAIVYQGVIGRWTPATAMIEGLWTPPQHRGKGYGKRGFAAITREALARAAQAMVATREENAVQLGIEAATGYTRLPQVQRAIVWHAPAATG